VLNDTTTRKTWRAWLLLAVACWACVAPTAALTPNLALGWQETRTSDSFANDGDSRVAEPRQVAAPHQGETRCAHERASRVHNYLYAHADPVQFGDPSGYQSILIASLTNFAIRTIAYMAVVAPPVAAGARAISRIDMARVAQFLRTIQVSAVTNGHRITQLTRQANQRYPKLVGKFEEHHFMTKQLVKRLAERGVHVPPAIADKTVRLEAPYHRLITNAIRERFAVGAKVFDKVKPTLDDVLRELETIYDDLPLL